jgi:hypothetical protein
MAINHKCFQQSSNNKKITKYQRNFEKKATKVPILESTKLASENVATNVSKSENDTSFESNDLEDDLAGKQMVNNLWNNTKMPNDTLQALGRSMSAHIQV